MDIYFCIILAEKWKQVFAKMQKCKFAKTTERVYSAFRVKYYSFTHCFVKSAFLSRSHSRRTFKMPNWHHEHKTRSIFKNISYSLCFTELGVTVLGSVFLVTLCRCSCLPAVLLAGRWFLAECRARKNVCCSLPSCLFPWNCASIPQNTGYLHFLCSHSCPQCDKCWCLKAGCLPIDKLMQIVLPRSDIWSFHTQSTIADIRIEGHIGTF